MVFKKVAITPEVIQKLVSIVNELEGGSTVTGEQIEVSTFDSGAVSTIFRVTFLQPLDKPTQIPPSIVIKIYQTDEKLPYDITTSQLNNLFIGQSGLGPRVLLIRKDAIIWEYLPAVRGLSPTEDDHNLATRELIARKLARFHALSVPIPRNTHQTTIRYIFTSWLEEKWIDALQEPDHSMATAARTADCRTLLDGQYNLKSELAFVRDTILALPSPRIVYSHCDFNHSNILVQGDSEEVGGIKDICFIDFDFSGYFYRGADLAHYLTDCTHIESWDDNILIPDDQMRQFIAWYRAESLTLSSPYSCQPEDDIDSVEAILKEAKLFILYCHFVDLIFCLWNAWIIQDDEVKRAEYLGFVEKRFRSYLRAKARFIEDGSIDPGTF